jgi:GAF domain-containing protein
MGVPLMTPSRIYGWLCLADKLGAQCFDADDERLLETLGAAVTRYYENIRRQSELQRQTAKLHRAYAVLGGLSALIARMQDRDSVCREACRLSVERARYRLAYIEMAESADRPTQCVAAAGDAADVERFARRRPGERRRQDELVDAALSADAAAVCNDLEATRLGITQRHELLERGYRSIAVLPLSGTHRGRLVVLADQSGTFDDAELRLLNEFSGGVALALAQVMETASISG